MAHKPKTDDRQTDFFATPASVPVAPVPRAGRQPKASQTSTGPTPPPNSDRAPERDNLDTLAARLSQAELTELVAALSDPALAHLVIVAVRQLRRRLARTHWQAGKRRTPSPLERAARQLISELGEYGGDDDF